MPTPADSPSPTPSTRAERQAERINAQKERLSAEQVQKLTLIFSLMIGAAAMVAVWAGRDRLILLAIPLAIMASIAAIVLPNPAFPRQRWLVILALPILFWTIGLVVNP